MKKLFTLILFILLTGYSYSQIGACIGSSTISISPPPDSATGCYFPGDTVTVCVTINDYLQTGADWLCGVVPFLGPGWDSTSLAPVTIPPSCDGLGYWNWYSSCTGLNSGIVFGAGFFYDSQQGPPLFAIDSLPGNNFGDNCGINTWIFCYRVTVSANATGGTTGQIGVTAYGDDQAGSWTNPGCVDPPITASYCIAPCTVTVPSVTTHDITTCYGDSTGSAVVIPSGGTAPYAYQWSTGAITDSISGLSAGVYSVIVTDLSGCQKTVYLLIQGPQQIVFNPSVIGIGCTAGSTGSITTNISGGTPPFIYMWSNGATTASITGLAGGTYTLTVTDSTGCTNSGFWTIPIVPPLNVTYTSTDATCGISNGTATVTASGTPPYTYTWTPPVSTTANATGLSAGVYIVQVTDSNGCSVTDTITVNQITTFTVSTAANTANCAGTGGSGTVSVIGSSGPYTYQWSPSGGTDSTATNLTTGTYTVVVTDVNSCSQTVTVVVAQMTSSVTVTTLVTQSPCDTTTLATIGTNPGNGTLPYTYIWTTGATTATVTGLGAGTYTVIVTDSNQCTATATATIAPFNPVSIATSSSQSCFENPTGSASVITTSGGSSPYSYQWSNGSTDASINGIAGGNYTVTVTDANSCSVTSVVNVASLPAINVSVVPDSSNGAPPLTVNFTNNSTGGITYSWNFGDGSPASSGHDATHIYASDGTYHGFVVVTNSDGCIDTGKFVVIVLTSSGLTIYNVFTPNTDSQNDFWTITAHGILSLSTEIYNRWGEKIFEHDYANGGLDGDIQVWNGLAKNGKEAASGTYFYIVKAHGTDKDYDQSGTITLIREVKK